MKKFIYSLSVMLSAIAFTGCSDFFDPDTDDELQGSKYISSDTEMYTGFLGIMTKMQAIGDKEILLTETRGELVEVTERSAAELVAIYNYEDNLQGNSYANPAGYYDLIIACNDYLVKLKEYQSQAGVDKTIWDNLVSSTLRTKVWAYKTLGEIYGQAVWFDDPLVSFTEVSSAAGFQLMDIHQLIDKCIATLDAGIYGVPSTLELLWTSWIDPDHALADSEYRPWDNMVIPYEGLYAELLLWKAASIESRSADATLASAETKPIYQKAFDILVNKVTNKIMEMHPNNGGKWSSSYWIPSGYIAGKYANYWDNLNPLANENACCIIYDYTKNQTNTLLKHFSNDYPNKYLLRPSKAGMARFSDESFSPGSDAGSGKSADGRYSATIYENWNGGDVIQKFRKVKSSVRSNAYQDDVQIYVYRATQYHTMMCEALNHLKRYDAFDAVLNKGVNSAYVADSPAWEGFNAYWTTNHAGGSNAYPSTGIRGYMNLGSRTLVTDPYGTTERAMAKHNDLQILDECMLEFGCEGKVYPVMNRMALRYGDLDIVADRVCPKYEASGKDGEIRAKILAGGNWVPYDLEFVATAAE